MLSWIGVSWRSVSSRRRAALSELDVPGRLAIHTCARDAWLVEGDPSALCEALRRRGILNMELELHRDREAIVRLFSVAIGLDSAVQGEADVGRQVRAALVGGPAPLAPVLDHVLARLLRVGRRDGWVREGHGVVSLAVRTLGRTEAGGDTRSQEQSTNQAMWSIGVVGAGRVGAQLSRALGPRAVVYNRTAGPGILPLERLQPAEAWVVATAAPQPWFVPPEPYRVLLDLGHPAQCLEDPRHLSLDRLLLKSEARLAPASCRAAERAVSAAADEVLFRLSRREAVSVGLFV